MVRGDHASYGQGRRSRIPGHAEALQRPGSRHPDDFCRAMELLQPHRRSAPPAGRAARRPDRVSEGRPESVEGRNIVSIGARTYQISLGGLLGACAPAISRMKSFAGGAGGAFQKAPPGKFPQPAPFSPDTRSGQFPIPLSSPAAALLRCREIAEDRCRRKGDPSLRSGQAPPLPYSRAEHGETAVARCHRKAPPGKNLPGPPGIVLFPVFPAKSSPPPGRGCFPPAGRGGLSPALRNRTSG